MPQLPLILQPPFDTTLDLRITNLQAILHPTPPMSQLSMLPQYMNQFPVPTCQYLLIYDLPYLEWKHHQECRLGLVIRTLPRASDTISNAMRQILRHLDSRQWTRKSALSFSWKGNRRIERILSSSSSRKLMDIRLPSELRGPVIVVHSQEPDHRSH